MAQRNQRGWLKQEMRARGPTWVLFFRTARKSDGRRVEHFREFAADAAQARAGSVSS